MEKKMANHDKSSDITLEDVKKSIDRLTIIELVKSGATRDQIREVMGSINNIQLSKIKRAINKGQQAAEE
jgi:uncharacterized protein YerC